MIRSNEFKIFIFLFLLALLARLFFFGSMLWHYGPGSFYLANHGAPLTVNDSMNYVVIAKNLVAHGAYSRFVDPPFDPDSFRTPLLPLYFAPFVHVFGMSGITVAMLVLNIILSCTAIAVYSLGRQFLSERMSVWAGVMVALEPLLAYRSNIAEPDALIVLLCVSAVYSFVLFWRTSQSKYIFATFTLLSLLTLAKPVGAFLIPFFSLLAALKWRLNKTPFTRVVRFLFVSALICAAFVGPWIYRNYRVFGVWGISSVKAYNLYNYYTADLALENEPPPLYTHVDQDPIRNLAHARRITAIAVARIKQKPLEYAKRHVLGTVRNLLASDLPVFYHHGHEALLPFAYHPVNGVNISRLMLDGEIKALFINLSRGNTAYLLRHLIFVVFYLVMVFAWMKSCGRNRETFWFFTMFLALVFYLVFTPGTFVDAKYRLPAVPFLFIIFLYYFDTAHRKSVAPHLV